MSNNTYQDVFDATRFIRELDRMAMEKQRDERDSILNDAVFRRQLVLAIAGEFFAAGSLHATTAEAAARVVQIADAVIEAERG